MCSAHEEIGAQSNAMTPVVIPTPNTSATPPIAINPLITDEQLQVAVEAIKRQRGGNISNGLVDHRVGLRNHPTARGRKLNCSKCKSWHFPT